MDTKEQILEKLNEQQKLPVINYPKSMAVIASAGSGKTFLITQRVAYMVLDGIKPENILMFTFTKKAAEEMKERIIKTVGEQAENLTVCTYHAFCVKLLRKYCHLIGFSNPFSIYDPEQCFEIIMGILKRNELDYDPGFVLSYISDCKLNMLSPDDAIASEVDNIEYAYIYKEFQQILKAQNAFNFDDLIYFTIRILENFEDVLCEVNSQYQYIMADEFQDSSTQDIRFIKLLAGKKFHLCMVGDNDQSIYAFRGADISAWGQFVKEHNVTVYKLEQNYRSTQTIVNASNSVIENNTKLFDKVAYSKGEVGASVVSFELDTHKKEATRITQIVKSCIKQGYREEDIAVLYRMSYLGRTVEDSFLANGVNYHIVNGLPFYNRAEVKDLLSYLQVFNNPKDFTAICRALQVPKRGFGEKAIETLTFHFLNRTDEVKNVTTMKKVLMSCEGLTAKQKIGMRNFIAIMEQIEINSAFMNPAMLIDYIAEAVNYREYIKKTKDAEEFEARWQIVQELIAIAKQSNDLQDLLESMAVGQKESDGKSGGVTLTTIHSSKGLEWPIVIVMGCNEMQIPSFMAIKSHMEEEERRLFYVAMTRAKSFLFLTRHNKSNSRGTWRNYDESRFVKEIDDKYIKRM
jgi:ATP-dependent DNA helicase pcrA